MNKERKLNRLRSEYVELMKYFYMAQRPELQEDVANNMADLQVATEMDRIKNFDNDAKISYINGQILIIVEEMRGMSINANRQDFLANLSNFHLQVLLPRIRAATTRRGGKKLKKRQKTKRRQKTRQHRK